MTGTDKTSFFLNVLKKKKKEKRKKQNKCTSSMENFDLIDCYHIHETVFVIG